MADREKTSDPWRARTQKAMRGVPSPLLHAFDEVCESDNVELRVAYTGMIAAWVSAPPAAREAVVEWVILARRKADARDWSAIAEVFSEATINERASRQDK